MAAPVDGMTCRLAEERLHETSETVIAAWDEMVNAIGLVLEGRATLGRVRLAQAQLADAERIAHAEVVAGLAMIGVCDG